MMNRVSKELQEVWDIKDACYEEVKDLPLLDALEKRLTDSMKTIIEMGIELSKDKKIILK